MLKSVPFAVLPAVLLAGTMMPVFSNTHNLTVGDTLGNTSFNAKGGWSSLAAPAAGDDYTVSLEGLRTPPNADSHEFAGKSLTINAGGLLNFKGAGNGAVITVNDFILNGGTFRTNSSSADVFTLAGNLKITAASTLHAKQGPMIIQSAISGTGNVTVSPSDNNNGNALTIAGENTGSGSITNNGNLIFSETSVQTFVLQPAGVANQILGTGLVAFNGMFRINTSATGAATPGTAWPLVDVATLTETFGTGFSVEDYTESGDVWISPTGDYQFNKGTGLLSRVSPDSDLDGLPDAWEAEHFGGTTQQDGAGDKDGDGANNLSEFLASTDPDAPASFPDTDTDGLPDPWEIAIFGNLNEGAAGDADGDYATNLQEYTAVPRTAPNDPVEFPDTDGDGIADAWETTFFANPAACDPAVDGDGDFFSNLDEFTARTNPTDQVSSPDTDGDGLADGWEVKYFRAGAEDLNTVIAKWEGTSDPDGDGFINLLEAGAGTDPNNALSFNATLAYWRFEEQTAGLMTAGVDEVAGDSEGGNGLRTYADYTAPTYTEDVPFATVPVKGTANTASLRFTAVDGNRYTCSNIYTGAAAINTHVFEAFTLEASFKTTRSGLNQGIIGKGGNPAGMAVPYQAPFTLKINTAGNVVAGLVDDSLTAREVLSARTVATGVWYSTAVTATATTLSLWLKGPEDTAYVLESSMTIDGAYTSGVLDKAWVIGQTEWNANGDFGGFDSFTGNLDEIRFTALALPVSQFLGSTPSAVTDTDGDGLEDGWETTHFGSLAQTAAGDFDGDGTSNLTEFKLGLDPKSSVSRFAATLTAAGAITWPSAEGLTFTIQRSTTLTDWSPVGTVPGTAGTGTFTDPQPPAGRAFYRVVLP